MYTHRNECRACSCEDLKPAFDLGLKPLANDFRKASEPRAGYAPLKVMFCPRCTLAQLSVVVDPRVMYDHYSYVTSPSDTMRKHFDALATGIETRHRLGNVLEIGSNDGTLLKHLSDNYAPGVERVFGVDPAANLVAVARANGIESLTGFWGRENAAVVNGLMPIVDTVIARHVFAHANDWADFIKGLETVCHDRTLIAIEVPYVLDLLNGNAFDTIYHEHLSYVSVKAMHAALAGSDLIVKDILHFALHGGVIVFMIGRNNWRGKGDTPMAEIVRKYIAKEDRELSVESWQAMRARSGVLVLELQREVAVLRQLGKKVCVYGASAKSTVWMNECGFTAKDICFITDTTSWKQGTLAPGSEIPVVAESRLYDGVDYAILCAWNYRDEVLKKHKAFSDAGGKFIVPAPKLEIV